MSFSIKIDGIFYTVPMNDALLFMSTLEAGPQDKELFFSSWKRYFLKHKEGEKLPTNGYLNFDATMVWESPHPIVFDMDGKQSDRYSCQRL